MPLAHHLRDLHSRAALHHCPICHQWFTRTQDIFRHLKKQHPLTKIQDSLRADWLQARTAAARSPCSWRKTLASYKTQHVAACPVLQQAITLRLLVRHELGLSCGHRHDSTGCQDEGGSGRAATPPMLGRRLDVPSRSGVLLEAPQSAGRGRARRQEQQQVGAAGIQGWFRPRGQGQRQPGQLPGPPVSAAPGSSAPDEVRCVQATGLHPQACWRTELSPEESGQGGGRMKRGADKADASGGCNRTVIEAAGRNIPG